MFSTKVVVRAFNLANAGVTITEDRVRHAIRRGVVSPKSFAGRLVWTAEEVRVLARQLNLNPPVLEAQGREPVAVR